MLRQPKTVHWAPLWAGVEDPAAGEQGASVTPLLQTPPWPPPVCPSSCPPERPGCLHLHAPGPVHPLCWDPDAPQAPLWREQLPCEWHFLIVQERARLLPSPGALPLQSAAWPQGAGPVWKPHPWPRSSWCWRPGLGQGDGGERSRGRALVCQPGVLMGQGHRTQTHMEGAGEQGDPSPGYTLRESGPHSLPRRGGGPGLPCHLVPLRPHGSSPTLPQQPRPGLQPSAFCPGFAEPQVQEVKAVGGGSVPRGKGHRPAEGSSRARPCTGPRLCPQ